MMRLSLRIERPLDKEGRYCINIYGQQTMGGSPERELNERYISSLK
jgi:hypothetical protein